MKRIYVRTHGGNYPVLIGRNLLKSIGPLARQLRLGPKCFIVSDKKIAARYLSTVRRSLKKCGFDVSSYLLPYSDERNKSERVLSRLWREMAEASLERTSTVVALGGGVVGDLAGFAASTYMRGIPLVHVPTTLLAQVDSAIGGKTAIDLPSGKNTVGSFYQPKLVVSDIETLKTLGVSDLRNSFAEIIKCGMIRDARLFELLERDGASFFDAVKRGRFGKTETAFLETIVRRSAKIKAGIVHRDERETKGERMILNYGHTFGHAIEAASKFRMAHGSAVAIGMVLAARLACRRGLLSIEAQNRQRALIRQIGLPSSLRSEDYPLKLGLPVQWKKGGHSSGELLSFMKRDKKIRDGKMRFVLPRTIGRVEICSGISDREIKSVLSEG
ncbi:MAG: 3-dehydroquinate synthase [Omnitrophica bacterium RIFCSPLOWO2_01_FULL_50_24]|nr:MAG: 3-dehydroquinate synthase [Omnitrophica bacterium RIFCSPLOWO2_01_FULL_50_24]